jgi:hypothetical protein
MGVTFGYLNQLSYGRRVPENISDEFAGVVAEVAGLPRLVVMFIAGRVERNLFSELGQAGEAVARHIAESAAKALVDARQDVELAEARVIAEERRVRAARKIPSDVAKALHAEMVEFQRLFTEVAGLPADGAMSAVCKALLKLAHVANPPESAEAA